MSGSVKLRLRWIHSGVGELGVLLCVVDGVCDGMGDVRWVVR